MIQLVLYLIKWLVMGLFGLSGAVLMVFAIIKRRDKVGKYVFIPLTILSFAVVALVWRFDLNESESTDREDLVAAFESNFGFTAPESVKEIKVKNYAMLDASGHWMSFTYDSLVFQKIVEADTVLKLADQNSSEFTEAMRETKEGSVNAPEWFDPLSERHMNVYFKKDFMAHTYSAFYLWRNKESNCVQLYVTYFD